MLVPRTKQDLSGTLIQIFPFFSTFRLRHLDENGRNLYNYICICSPNMRRQGTYFTKKKVTRASACGTRFLFY